MKIILSQLRPTYIGHSADVRRKSVHYLKRELEIDYHIADWEVLCSRFNTDLNKVGLEKLRLFIRIDFYSYDLLSLGNLRLVF